MAATKTKRAVKDRRPKRKSCNFCADKAIDISYRDVNRLKKYVSERGKIVRAASPAIAQSTSVCSPSR